MQLFLGNEGTVYILDKSEANKVQINGHPAMGSVYDIASRTAKPIDVASNPFCSSGMHMPNGSFITFGGNGAIGPGGDVGDIDKGSYDTVFGDLAGQTSIRVMNPLSCTGDSATTSPDCAWYDNANVTHLQSMRWYSTAEPMADGTVAVIGGFTNGGYINRNYPTTTDPIFQGGASQPTYETWPSNGQTPPIVQFLVDTGGLDAYPHTYLLASGKMILQANVSTSASVSCLTPPRAHGSLSDLGSHH